MSKRLEGTVMNVFITHRKSIHIIHRTTTNKQTDCSFPLRKAESILVNKVFLQILHQPAYASYLIYF